MNTQIRFVVCVACLLVPATVFGQARLTGADLGGVLTDSTGGVLPGAIVTVTNVETNVARSVVSDGNGKYLAPALPPGTYTITVELQGFATKTRRGVVLTRNTRARNLNPFRFLVLSWLIGKIRHA